MDENLKSLLVLFLSTCVIYIYRIYRDILVITDSFQSNASVLILYGCKIAQIMGICYSLYLRVNLVARNPDEETTTLRGSLNVGLSRDSL